jgi:predicted Zn-dependent protease
LYHVLFQTSDLTIDFIRSPASKHFEEVVMIRSSWVLFIVAISCVTGSCAGSDHQLPVVSEKEHAQAEQKILSAPNLSPTTRTAEENEQIARRVTKRLQSAAAPICRSTERGHCWYTLEFKPDGQINAYTFKNHIVLFNGLAQYLETDDEFAAVLGHEMGHDIAGHYEKALLNREIGAALGGILFAGIAAAAGYDSYQARSDVETSMEFGAAIGGISFSKEHEREADYIAAYLMTRAGYNPDAASSLWVKLTKAGGRMKTGLFDTHPSGPDRLAAWEETVNEVRFSKDLLPNLAGAEPESRLQQARVFDDAAVNSRVDDSTLAMATKPYQPDHSSAADYGRALNGGTQALVGRGTSPTINSTWIAQGSYDNCGAEWALKIERNGSVIRGNMWWKDARYDVYGRLDHKGHTTDAHAGKSKEFQTTPAPRFFRLDIVFEPNAARGRYAMDSSGAACGADFVMARLSN